MGEDDTSGELRNALRMFTMTAPLASAGGAAMPAAHTFARLSDVVWPHHSITAARFLSAKLQRAAPQIVAAVGPRRRVSPTYTTHRAAILVDGCRWYWQRPAALRFGLGCQPLRNLSPSLGCGSPMQCPKRL